MNRLYRSWFFPLSLQVLCLGAFGLLIAGGLAANSKDPAFSVVLRNTNLANLVVWSYWWPAIILSAVVFGRVWCMVCPMELVTSLAARIGLKRRPPRAVRNGWTITVFYVLILFVGVHILAIHRVPYRMAIYMLLIAAAAVASGLVFSRNAFCAGICPVGHLLGLYARLAPFGWKVRDKELCRKCEDRSCVANATAYRFQGRSCGVGLTPGTLDDNVDCLLCGQCLKACDQNNPGTAGRPNPVLSTRPWAKDLWDLKPMTDAQAVFCIMVSGFVIYEIFTEWKVGKELLLVAPNQIAAWLGMTGTWGAGLTKSLTLFVVLPALLWLIPFGLFRLRGGAMALGEFTRTFGIAFIPIMASAHAVKALLKMTSRIPYWRGALEDPVGLETARGILDKSIALAPLPVWREPVMTAAAFVLITIGVIVSALLTRGLAGRLPAGNRAGSAVFYLIPALYGGLFMAFFAAWRLF